MNDEDFQPAGPIDPALLAAEEAKRIRVWDREERLRVIFETINWAESQHGVSRNNKVSCLLRAEAARNPSAHGRASGFGSS